MGITIKNYPNAIVMPLIGTMDKFTGGIFTQSGEFIEDCLPHRGSAPELLPPQKELSGTFIYGGCLFGHFGHFIWESLAHISAIRKCKNYPVVYISPNDHVFNIQKLLFKYIGIKNEIIVIKERTKIENLIYSSPGSSISPQFLTDLQLKDLVHFNFENVDSNENERKIWLSRSYLKEKKFRVIENEACLEKLLIKLGFTIIHPEYLSLYDQVRLISTAEIVAGFDGSQFYSALFSKHIRGNFYIFNSRPNIPQIVPYVFERKGINYSQYTFPLTPVNGYAHVCTYTMPEIDKIADILADVK